MRDTCPPQPKFAAAIHVSINQIHTTVALMFNTAAVAVAIAAIAAAVSVAAAVAAAVVFASDEMAATTNNSDTVILNHSARDGVVSGGRNVLQQVSNATDAWWRARGRGVSVVPWARVPWNARGIEWRGQHGSCGREGRFSRCKLQSLKLR